MAKKQKVLMQNNIAQSLTTAHKFLCAPTLQQCSAKPNSHVLVYVIAIKQPDSRVVHQSQQIAKV